MKTQVKTAAETDREIELELHRLVLENVTQQAGPTVSFTARELAIATDTSACDALNMTRELCLRWWIDGQRFLSFAMLQAYLRLNGGYDLAADVEIDFHREDCGARLVGCLVGTEGGLSMKPSGYWCPRCGTLKAVGGVPESESPMIVERLRQLVIVAGALQDMLAAGEHVIVSPGSVRAEAIRAALRAAEECLAPDERRTQ